MIIRVRPSSLNKNKTKLWRGNYKAKILDSKIRSSHALSKSAVPDTDHDNVGKKYNSTFHGGNSTRPLADRDTGRQAGSDDYFRLFHSMSEECHKEPAQRMQNAPKTGCILCLSLGRIRIGAPYRWNYFNSLNLSTKESWAPPNESGPGWIIYNFYIN